MKVMTNEEVLNRVKDLVVKYHNEHDAEVKVTRADVYIVWFSKTLQNWKALAATDVHDGMYYELTYNGDNGETYFDAYKKVENVLIPD